MESTKEIDGLLEDTEILEELLSKDNVEAVPTDNCDIISIGEESVIEECLNDTDESLSSVNLDFFNDYKPLKPRQKKTMEKRKEERKSFRHVVAKETASDNDDDEDSLQKSLESELALLASQIQEIKDSILSRKNSMITDTAIDKNILDNLDEMNQLKKILHTPKSDKERESEEFLIDDNIKMGVLRQKEGLLEEEINDVTDIVKEKEFSNMNLKLLSMSKGRNISKVNRRKRMFLSPESDSEEKSDQEFQNIETNEAVDDIESSTSKNAYVTNKRVGGLKRLLISECDENKEELYSNEEEPTSSKNPDVAKRKVVKRKRRVSAKRQVVAKNAHIYSFFSSMADLVSKLPYSMTLTAKARVTKMLEEIVARATKPQDDSLPLEANTRNEISEEDLKLIKLRLSQLPYIY